MWSNIPFDLLANIFSFLAPDSLARARSACRHWHACARCTPPSETQHPAWFIALPMRSPLLSCYAHNPIDNNWHTISLDFIPTQTRPIASIHGLILFRTNSTTADLQLAICNPFTRQFRHLPMLNIPRTSPAIGLIELDPIHRSRAPNFTVYVAGGMSEAPSGGASYEPTLEMYDSHYDTWKIIGSMPIKLAVRLTVWTPNESVCFNGILYWMTSARAYSVMGFEIDTNKWRELSVPMASRLEFATLVPRNGKLTLVGGTCEDDMWIWELGEDDIWFVVEKVPVELGMRFLGGKGSWGSVKCVGVDDAVCLYRELGSRMVFWRKVVAKGKWEWICIEGCSIRGMKLQTCPIKGLLLHPNLAPSCLLVV